ERGRICNPLRSFRTGHRHFLARMEKPPMCRFTILYSQLTRSTTCDAWPGTNLRTKQMAAYNPRFSGVSIQKLQATASRRSLVRSDRFQRAQDGDHRQEDSGNTLGLDEEGSRLISTREVIVHGVSLEQDAHRTVHAAANDSRFAGQRRVGKAEEGQK